MVRGFQAVAEKETAMKTTTKKLSLNKDTVKVLRVRSSLRTGGSNQTGSCYVSVCNCPTQGAACGSVGTSCCPQ